MKFFTSIVFLIYTLAATVLAAPLDKRIYQPTSAVFSLIAHHKGAIFQYNLVKFDGTELVLDADDAAFFGRIKGSTGYTLNLPKANVNSSSNSTSNSTALASTTSVIVNSKNQLITSKTGVNASEDFGVEKSLLTYKGSNKFVACPDRSYKQQYGIFFQGNVTNSSTICPNNATGYEIQLMIQVDATLNYSPETNKNTISTRFINTLKRAVRA
ncbi:hypothetical protein CLIB1423_02S10088 [[Candida] railenensis]|uniref:Uncharacterized protein n=1 Tax=[Candida] railenensis TaxID=45579 RepID=A0A9P0VWJ7_9ASCO|nr:hypothetical protein CLIB1423_02S10088 [[Candida] railenensis]